MTRYLLSLLLVLAPISARAGAFYDLSQTASSATMKLSGVMKIAASSSTPNTAVITLDGKNSLITAPAISISGNAAAATGSFSGLLSLNGTQMVKFNSGGGYHTGLQSFLDSGKPGVQFYDTDTFNNTVGLKLGGLYAPVLYGAYSGFSPYLGINNSAPTVALDVTGGIKGSSITATAGFYGDGSNLTNVKATTETVTTTIYYCNGGTNVGILCRGNACIFCAGGSWVNTGIAIP